MGTKEIYLRNTYRHVLQS